MTARSAPSPAADPLDRAERAALLDAAASGLRHDLRNKLGTVRNAAFYIRRRVDAAGLLESEPRMKTFFDVIDAEIRDASSLLEARAVLADGPATSTAEEAARLAVAFARSPLAPRPPVKIAVAPERVDGNPHELAAALRCLLENALEAGARQVEVTGASEADLYAFEVKDDGAGFAASIEDALTPYHTTKPGRLGLGLNVAKRTAERHGGRLDIRSTTEGSIVSFAVRRAAVRQPEGGAGARILFADDDDANRLTMSALLEDEGFRVEAVGSYREAAERVASSEAAYELILLDQHLGDGIGADLVPEVRRKCPGARVVILSGSSAADEALAHAPDRFVTKGDSFDAVVAVLRGLLER